MSPEFKTFRAAVGDVPLLAPLFDAYRVFYGQSSDLQLAENLLFNRLNTGESVILSCCQSPGSAPAGFTQLYPSFSSTSAGRIWILNDLFVAPAFRRLGVGRVLIQAAHDHARETGALEVVLSTAHTNQAAQALYESIGYIQDTEFRSYSFAVRPT